MKRLSCGGICHVLMSVLKKRHMQSAYVINQNCIPHNAGQGCFSFLLIPQRICLDFFLQEKDELYSAVTKL